MQTIYLSEGTAARRRVYIRLVQSADGTSAATASQVTAAAARFIVNGADGGATTNNITEVDGTDAPGWWYLELTAGEITTLGVGNHAIRFKETDTLESLGGEFQIVGWDWWAAGVPVLSLAANSVTASALATDAGTEIANAVWDQANGIETGYTPRQTTRIIAAAVAGKSADGGTTFRDLADAKDRITSTVDGSGNRTVVTHDGT